VLEVLLPHGHATFKPGQVFSQPVEIHPVVRDLGIGQTSDGTGEDLGVPTSDSLSLDDKVIFRQANRARLFSPSGKEMRVWRPEPQAADSR